VPENGVMVEKPDNISHEEAAVIPMGAIMALYLLREKGNLQAGSKVLINGASGSIGSAAVQIAKNHFGAKVTGVCGTLRTEFVKSLGADKVIDYSKEDFTEYDEKYDLIFDILGKSKFSACKKVLRKNGRYLLASFKGRQVLKMLWTKIFSNKKLICGIAPGSLKDLQAVKELIEEGKLKSIVDKSFPMEKAAEAHSYVEDGYKKGDVVITITQA
jgi:NADPH:quinone reductase-like Zn-dependent oxidoreductase